MAKEFPNKSLSIYANDIIPLRYNTTKHFLTYRHKASEERP